MVLLLKIVDLRVQCGMISYKSSAAGLPLLDKADHSFFSPCGILQQWTNLCRIIDSGEWKKTDSKNGITISRLSFTNNEKAAVKVKITGTYCMQKDVQVFHSCNYNAT